MGRSILTVGGTIHGADVLDIFNKKEKLTSSFLLPDCESTMTAALL